MSWSFIDGDEALVRALVRTRAAKSRDVSLRRRSAGRMRLSRIRCGPAKLKGDFGQQPACGRFLEREQACSLYPTASFRIRDDGFRCWLPRRRGLEGAVEEFDDAGLLPEFDERVADHVRAQHREQFVGLACQV